MRCCRFLLALVLPATLALPASAGIFDFFKHTKPDPKKRVPRLIAVLKTETDEDKRTNAAKELRDYDPTAFPDVVPVLLDALQHDPKPGVRAEAAQSLSRLRPISKEVGWALEEATHDSSIRVRWQARNSLMSYRMSGYRSTPKPEDASAKAPVINPPPAASRIPVIPQLWRSPVPPVPKTTPNLISGETPPPPLALPAPPTAAQPLPKKEPGQPTSAPAVAPKLQKPPAQSSEAGPDLSPIKDD
jgi:hypothetical protein